MLFNPIYTKRNPLGGFFPRFLYIFINVTKQQNLKLNCINFYILSAEKLISIHITMSGKYYIHAPTLLVGFILMRHKELNKRCNAVSTINTFAERLIYLIHSSLTFVE